MEIRAMAELAHQEIQTRCATYGGRGGTALLARRGYDEFQSNSEQGPAV